MPSPIGHALAGVAAGWMIASPSQGARREVLLRGAAFALAATIADLDLLVGVHRGPTHSLTAAALAGAATWAWCAVIQARGLRRGQEQNASHHRPLRLALAVTAAYATHTLLDWLGSDSSPPIGVMALWPASGDYYVSQRHVFLAISRRYWLPDFWTLNLRAVARELAILGPVVVLAWLRQSRRRATSADS